MTHLASADEDAAVTAAQLDRFDAVVSDLAGRGHRPRWVHAANSAGLACLRPSHTLVRPGLLLYGLHPRPHGPAIEVEPVMTLVARVALVRDVAAGTPVSYGGRWVAERASRIATLSMGYADGVPRTDLMAETGFVTIRGRRAKLTGTVCMDYVMADVTDLTDAGAGDEAIVFGDAPTAWDLASRAGTNVWQILTASGPACPASIPKREQAQDGLRLPGVRLRKLEVARALSRLRRVEQLRGGAAGGDRPGQRPALGVGLRNRLEAAALRSGRRCRGGPHAVGHRRVRPRPGRRDRAGVDGADRRRAGHRQEHAALAGRPPARAHRGSGAVRFRARSRSGRSSCGASASASRGVPCF